MDLGGTEEVFFDADEAAEFPLQVTVTSTAVSSTGEVYGLHRAAFEDDVARLSSLLQQLPPTEYSLQDPHGNTPLHVAALRGHCESIKVLLASGLSPSTKSRRGWTPLHEALAAAAVPAAKLLYHKIQQDEAVKVRAQREQLLDTMKELPDYSLQLKWSLGSSFPGLSLLLRKIAPHDTYTIWKKGDKLRVDGQLVGLDTKGIMPAWKRGHFSLLLDGSPEGREAAAAAAAQAVAEAKAVAENKRKARQQRHSSSRSPRLQQEVTQQQQEPQQGQTTSAGVIDSGGSSSTQQQLQQQQQQEQVFFDTDGPEPLTNGSSSVSGASSSSDPTSSTGLGQLHPASSSSQTAAAAAASPSFSSPACSNCIGGPRLLFVRHFKESYIDLSADLSGLQPDGEEFEQQLEDLLMMQMDGGVGKGRLKVRDLDFTPVKSWLGGNMTEKVEGWKCTVYEAAGKLLNYNKSKARLHLPKDATFYDYLSAEYAEDEVIETLIDPLSLEGMSAMSKDDSSHSRKSRASSSSHGDGDLFGEADPDYSDMMWDEKTSKKQKKKKKLFGNSSEADGAGDADKGGRVMRARCWMAQDFPMKLSQLLPLLNVIGTANKHMEKVSKFLSKYSEMDMFPVKLQAPLILTIYVLVSFKAFQPLLPNTSLPPPDEAFFAVPSHYKRRKLEDALDKAAMGMMRMSTAGREDGYETDHTFFYGGDEGEDMMLAELDARMMAEERDALEPGMKGLGLGQPGVGGLDSSQQTDHSGGMQGNAVGRESWGSDDSSSGSRASSRRGSRAGVDGSAVGKRRVTFREQDGGFVGSGLDVDIEQYSKASEPARQV